MGLNIQGEPFTGSQFDPPYGAFVWKYGVTSGWTYGYVGSYSTANVGTGCTVAALEYSGGTMSPNSAPGDSGGPYITEVWNGAGYSYYAHGTHIGRRGGSNTIILSVPIQDINWLGWTVG
jgi:hypothetical protein